MGKLNRTVVPKRGGETTWRKALQESWVRSRGLVLGLQRAQRQPGAAQGSEDGPDGDARDAGREEPDGTLIAISMLV